MKIYTCTLNPSLDQLCNYDLKLYSLNILDNVIRRPAGKGINVSRILQQMDIPSTLTGFLGGPNGLWIEKELCDSDFKMDFVKIKNSTRSNMKIYYDSKCTEINQKGPQISQSEADQLKEQLNKLSKDDLLVLSGSLPSGLSDNYLKDLIEAAHNKNSTVVLDSSGPDFFRALEASPDFIKPNNLELEELFKEQWPKGFSFEDLRKMTVLCKKLLEKYSMKGILLSLGKEGACIILKDAAFYAPAIQLEKAYPTGAGDSMVAALASVLYEQGLNEGDAELGLKILKRALTFAALVCSNPDDVLFSPADFEKMSKLCPEPEKI